MATLSPPPPRATHASMCRADSRPRVLPASSTVASEGKRQIRFISSTFRTSTIISSDHLMTPFNPGSCHLIIPSNVSINVPIATHFDVGFKPQISQKRGGLRYGIVRTCLEHLQQARHRVGLHESAHVGGIHRETGSGPGCTLPPVWGPPLERCHLSTITIGSGANSAGV